MASHRAPFSDPETPAFDVPELAYPAIKTNGDKTARGATAAVDHTQGSRSSDSAPVHGAPELVGANGNADGDEGGLTAVDAIDESKGGRFAYVRTRDFYIVLLLG